MKYHRVIICAIPCLRSFVWQFGPRWFSYCRKITQCHGLRLVVQLWDALSNPLWVRRIELGIFYLVLCRVAADSWPRSTTAWTIKPASRCHSPMSPLLSLLLLLLRVTNLMRKWVHAAFIASLWKKNVKDFIHARDVLKRNCNVAIITPMLTGRDYQIHF